MDMKKMPLAVNRLFLILIALSWVLMSCNLTQLFSQAEATPTIPPTELPSPAQTAESQPEAKKAQQIPFSAFLEPEVEIQPASLPVYDPDADTLRNPFMLSGYQISLLRQNGFVVSPGPEKEFFTVYEKARYANVPIFVTSDALLHVYHLLFDKVLRTAERDYFIDLLKQLNQALITEMDNQYQDLVGSDWEAAAQHAAAFIAVDDRLLDNNSPIPSYAADLVQGELAQIEAAAGTFPSPIFPDLPYGEDYTQYIPRGHYTLDEELEAYFKAMMWYGRMTFRLKTSDPEVGREETRQAILIVNALQNISIDGRSGLEVWSDLYAPTVFFVGRSDDLTILQYAELKDAIYGQDADLKTLTNDTFLTDFIDQANQLPAPRILGMVIDITMDEEETTKGMRFMGQRFVPDAYIFRELVFRNVGTPDDRRGLPMGLDLPAAMGSERAYEILEELNEPHYLNYTQQMDKVQAWFSGLDETEWTETLYNTWLYTFLPLMDETPGTSPSFMQNTAWQDKQLNTVLGSWAELKHDTILYAKQVYAEMGGGPPPPDPVPPRGYVEPVPYFYARLAALTRMTYEGLDDRNILNDLDRASLENLEDLALFLMNVSIKELEAQTLTEDEYERIRYIGGELEHFVMISSNSDADDPFAPKYLDEDPQAAVIADVATDPGAEGGAQVLEVGVGRINEIHVVVPIFLADGSMFWQVAKGGVFSYYEFPWPAQDRLTDDAWKTMLDEGTAPERPVWTDSFVSDSTEFNQLRLSISAYQKNVTSTFWYYNDMPESLDENPAMAPFRNELETARQAGEYIGRQFVSANYLLYDIRTDGLAVITVEETWTDRLYEGDIYSPSYPIAIRDTFTWIATYNLEQQEINGQLRWIVTQVNYDRTPPDWTVAE
jgi:hypothetical protein